MWIATAASKCKAAIKAHNGGVADFDRPHARVAFGLQVGDMVQGACDSEELAAHQNSDALAFLREARLGAPLFFTKGDHDISDTAGFVIGGSTSTTVLVRAIGPTLSADPCNVTDVIAGPQLELFRGTSLIGGNDDWDGTPALTTAFGAVGAFALPATSPDAALVVTLEPGSYTVKVSGVNDTTDWALVEVYEVPQFRDHRGAETGNCRHFPMVQLALVGFAGTLHLARDVDFIFHQPAAPESAPAPPPGLPMRCHGHVGIQQRIRHGHDIIEAALAVGALYFGFSTRRPHNRRAKSAAAIECRSIAPGLTPFTS
jgi:hypothetical protein